jgi:hypothetical protein
MKENNLTQTGDNTMSAIHSYTLGNTSSVVLTVKGSLENMETFLYTGVTGYNDFEMTDTELKIQWVLERPVCPLSGERYTVNQLINKLSIENVNHEIFKDTKMETISFK